MDYTEKELAYTLGDKFHAEETITPKERDEEPWFESDCWLGLDDGFLEGGKEEEVLRIQTLSIDMLTSMEVQPGDEIANLCADNLCFNPRHLFLIRPQEPESA